MQYSVLFGPTRVTAGEYKQVVTGFRAHRSERHPTEGGEFACNCTTSKRDRGPVLRGGLSNIPAHLYRCAGEKTGFVRSHNAIARVLHDASKTAKLAVVRELSDWVDGFQAFGHCLNWPKKRLNLLILIWQEEVSQGTQSSSDGAFRWFGDEACELFVTKVNRAFGTNRSSKGRWPTTWQNRLVATAVQGATMHLMSQTNMLLQRQQAARRRANRESAC